MTAQLQKAFEEASRLPVIQQDALGDWILKEIVSDRKWNEAFSRSQLALEKLTGEAVSEYRSSQ